MKIFKPAPLGIIMVSPIPPLRRRVGALSDVIGWLGRGETVAFSIAPTFAGFVGVESVPQWVGRLNEVGAVLVEETSVVLKRVIEMRYQVVENKRGWLTSCPRVVRLLRCKGLSAQLLAVPTPMGLHARKLRGELPSGAKVVFVGPCQYKHLEAQEDPEGPDATLLFDELTRWLGLVAAAPADFLAPAPCESRMAPFVQGISGIQRVSRFVNSGTHAMGGFELLGCRGGCLASPSRVSNAIFSERQRQLLKFASQNVNGIESKANSPA